MKGRPAAAAAIALALVGCAGDGPATATVQIGSERFDVEVARTADQQREGLAHRTRLDQGTGMLFTFDYAAEQQVWMAGVGIALDVAWIRDDQVIDVLTLDPCTEAEQDRCPRWTSPGDVDALLEVPAGSLTQISAGDPVTIEENERDPL